jgi:hypothetical protein
MDKRADGLQKAAMIVDMSTPHYEEHAPTARPAPAAVATDVATLDKPEDAAGSPAVEAVETPETFSKCLYPAFGIGGTG